MKDPRRCQWACDKLLIQYHDHEYGKIITDNNKLFEKLSEINGKKYWTIKIPLNIMLLFGYFILFLNKIFKIRPLITPQHIKKFNFNWECSSLKAENELGYKITSLTYGLSKTIQWLNSDLKS